MCTHFKLQYKGTEAAAAVGEEEEEEAARIELPRLCDSFTTATTAHPTIFSRYIFGGREKKKKMGSFFPGAKKMGK